MRGCSRQRTVTAAIKPPPLGLKTTPLEDGGPTTQLPAAVIAAPLLIRITVYAARRSIDVAQPCVADASHHVWSFVPATNLFIGPVGKRTSNTVPPDCIGTAAMCPP